MTRLASEAAGNLNKDANESLRERRLFRSIQGMVNMPEGMKEMLYQKKYIQ